MLFFFFFQAEDGIRDVAVTGVQTCALPICSGRRSPRGATSSGQWRRRRPPVPSSISRKLCASFSTTGSSWARARHAQGDRKSTRLNSSHGYISYAVFCLKKKKKTRRNVDTHESG